jgi:hypothetical protein
VDYFKIFTESIKLWWKNKFLWVLGIIAVIFGGGSGGGSINLPSTNNISQSDYNNYSYQIGNLFNNSLVIVILIALALVALILFVIGIYLKSRADASLISSTSLLTRNKDLKFKEAWGLSKKNWLKLFWLNLLVNLPIILIVILIVAGVVVFIMTSRGAEFPGMSFGILMLCIFSFVCLIVIYGVISKIVYTFAARIAVLEEKPAMESLKKGWNFVWKNISHRVVFWLLSLLASLATLPVVFIMVVILIPVILLIGLPLLLINVLLAIVIMIILFCVFGIIMTLISGPIYSFNEVYWTRVYLELTKK